MYVAIHGYFHDKIRIKYSVMEDVDSVDEIQHPIVKACLKLMKVEHGIEIASIADVPAGTGVGSSSTFTVCLLHALHTYKREYVPKEELAEEACKVEIEILKEPIGRQDQYAASYGGLNKIMFRPDDAVVVEPVVCTRQVKDELEKCLLLFYVGNNRMASGILSEQKANMAQQDKFKTVEQMVDLAEQMRQYLADGNLSAFGELLHQGWLLKKQVASRITNPAVDEFYEKALKAGALGGKLLGAGGGGFLLIFCRPENHERVRRSLALREMQFAFENEGSRIVYMD
jgi:D-glycero-alpha-D-manno-heptose-7-phosphate kinase